MVEPDAGGGGDDPPDGYARKAMGIRLLGDTIRRRRGEQGLSQKQAAKTWSFPYSTLCALEKGLVRNYQVTTIAPLDAILGVDAWAMLNRPDLPDVSDLRVELDELRAMVGELRAAVETIPPPAQAPAAGALEELGLTNGEISLVVAFAHLLLSRRNHG